MKVYVVTKNVLQSGDYGGDDLTTSVVSVFSDSDKAAAAAKEIGSQKTKTYDDGVTLIMNGTWGEVKELELID